MAVTSLTGRRLARTLNAQPLTESFFASRPSTSSFDITLGTGADAAKTADAAAAARAMAATVAAGNRKGEAEVSERSLELWQLAAEARARVKPLAEEKSEYETK